MESMTKIYTKMAVAITMVLMVSIIPMAAAQEQPSWACWAVLRTCHNNATTQEEFMQTCCPYIVDEMIVTDNQCFCLIKPQLPQNPVFAADLSNLLSLCSAPSFDTICPDSDSSPSPSPSSSSSSSPSSDGVPSATPPSSSPGPSVTPSAQPPSPNPTTGATPSALPPGSIPSTDLTPNAQPPSPTPSSDVTPSAQPLGPTPSSDVTPSAQPPGPTPSSDVTPSAQPPESTPSIDITPSTPPPGSTPSEDVNPDTPPTEDEAPGLIPPSITPPAADDIEDEQNAASMMGMTRSFSGLLILFTFILFN